MKTQYNRAVSLLACTAILLSLISGCTEGTWHDRTPIDGGRLSALVASPDDSNVLIAGTPGGGIWRTRDGGANWTQPEGYALADFTILDLQWDKVVSGRLLACTPSDVYASLDMGDHQTKIYLNQVKKKLSIQF